MAADAHADAMSPPPRLRSYERLLQELEGAEMAAAAPRRFERRRWAATAAALASAGLTLAVAVGSWASRGPGRGAEPSAAAAQAKYAAPWNGKCPGNIGVKGYGAVSLVNAQWNVPLEAAGPVFPEGGNAIVPHMTGRTYFGDSCQEGAYDASSYARFQLLGKTMRYSTNLKGAGCGCNAALYLVSMPRNAKQGKCSDYYCDAMKVCGIPCTEIDIQEANMHAWFSTLHLWDDGLGVGLGYGGDLNEPLHRDWLKAQYGPKAACIDTEEAFQVAVSFPVNADGRLEAFEVELSQRGKPCNVSGRVDTYNAGLRRDAMAELAWQLEQGMTPVISLWSSEDMAWLDGPGSDGKGPNCPVGSDDPSQCPTKASFYDFSVEEVSLSVPRQPVAAHGYERS